MSVKYSSSIYQNIFSPIGGSLLLFLFFLFLYASSVPVSNVGYTDSDLMLALAKSGGVGLPPGYPLYLLLLKLFMYLPLFGLSLTTKGHLLSSILTAVSLSLLFAALIGLYPKFKKSNLDSYKLFNPEIENWIISFFSVFLLGTAHFYWLYGIVAESVSFTFFIIALVVLSVTKIATAKVSLRINFWWYCFGIACTISVFHYPLILLALPLIFWYFLGKPKNRYQQIPIKNLISIIVITFLVICGIFMVFNLSKAPLSMRIEPTYSGIIDYFRLSEPFPGLFRSGLRSSWYAPSQDINQSFNSFISYVKLVLTTYGWWLVLVIPLGLYRGLRNNKKLIELYLSIFIVVGILPVLYFLYNTEWSAQAYLVRLMVPSFIWLAILAFPGWIDLITRTGSMLTVLLSKRLVNSGLTFIMLIMMVGLAITRYPQLNLHKYSLVADRYHNILKSLDQNAIATCFSDLSCNALMYEQAILHTRPDVVIVPLNFKLIEHSTLAQKNLRLFTDRKQPDIIFDVVTTNLSAKPVYAIEINNQYYQLFGLDFPFMFYIPQGAYGKLQRQLSENLIASQAAFISPVPFNPQKVQWDSNRINHLSAIARDHILNGAILLKMNLRPQSLQEINSAASIFNQFSQKDKSDFNALRSNIEYYQPNLKFSPGSSVPQSKDLLALVPALLKDQRIKQAYYYVLSAVVNNPSDIASRLLLAQLTEQLGNPAQALVEYSHVLQLDPENATASSQMSELNLP